MSDNITPELIEEIKKELIEGKGKNVNIVAAMFRRPRWLIVKIRDSIPQEAYRHDGLNGVKPRQESAKSQEKRFNGYKNDKRDTSDLVALVRQDLLNGIPVQAICAEYRITKEFILIVKEEIKEFVPEPVPIGSVPVRNVCTKCGRHGAIFDRVSGICVACAARSFQKNNGITCYK